MSSETAINRSHCTNQLRVDYAHVGLFDVSDRSLWIAKKRFGTKPIQVSHARLLKHGSNNSSTADKDRFLCYWFHTPNTGEGYVHGYPIEWAEAHLMIRLDPNWNYATQEFIASVESAKVGRNIDQQYKWGESIFRCYVEKRPAFPLSWHLIGPRATDCMFYIERWEPQ